MTDEQCKAIVMAILASRLSDFGIEASLGFAALGDQVATIMAEAGATAECRANAELEAARKRIAELEAQIEALATVSDNNAEIATAAQNDAQEWCDRVREIVEEWKRGGLTPELGELIDAGQTALNIRAAAEARAEELDGEETGAGL